MSPTSSTEECRQTQPAAFSASEEAAQREEVLITGAAGYLGREVVRWFSSTDCYAITAVVRRHEQFSRVPDASSIRKVAVELTDEQAVAAALQAHYPHQPPDHVLLLAGGFALGDIAQSPQHALRHMMAINFESAYSVVRVLLPAMLQRGSGRFIFMGSVAALEPQTAQRMIAYGLSKSLLIQLAKYINAMAEGTQVAATVLVPHVIDTPDNRRSMPHADFRQWVKPSHLAELMHQLCRGAARGLRQPVLRVWPQG
ncbi:MAG: SDR family NAD(P)-dependent oxidoreductase [Chitinophagales bacterium]|nr:SDR family NAD(P)-dependent oxidoreductase [Chitinophagales bacterium]MDW8428620.1 SDR family NAD(P)-dependent oxidoreductase [Chitinophagales bacterium]